MLLTVQHLSVSTDAVAFNNAHFGAGTGTIYLDDVGCTGSETNLIDCSRSSTVRCSRGHLDDAGVRCQGLNGTEMLHLQLAIYKSANIIGESL